MADTFKEIVRKSWLMVVIPMITCLIGYHSLFVESKTLEKVKIDYVSKTELRPILQDISSHTKQIEEHTSDIKQLTISSHQNELTIREISTNLKYITDLLNELKNDVRRIGAASANGK